jgi:hypothetical protein
LQGSFWGKEKSLLSLQISLHYVQVAWRVNRRKIKITEEMALSESRSRRLLVTLQPKCYLSTCPSSDFSPHALWLLLQEKKKKIRN